MTRGARSILAASLAFAAVVANAQTIYDPQGFEVPLFSLGDMVGQDGWQDSSSLPSSVEIVESTHPAGGDQMVRATHNSWGEAAAVVRPMSDTVGAFEKLSIEVDMRIDESWFAGMDEDSNYFTVLAVDFVTATGLISESYGAITFGSEHPLFPGEQGYALAKASKFIEFDLDDEWHRIGLALDNGTGEITGTLDGNVILTANYTPGEVTGILNVVLGSARFFGGQDTAYVDFDQLSVTVAPSAVPEPATVAVLGLAGLAMVTRRRRK
jgi:hypothetical protein